MTDFLSKLLKIFLYERKKKINVDVPDEHVKKIFGVEKHGY